jgi:type IV pilus assembly protein PilA
VIIANPQRGAFTNVSIKRHQSAFTLIEIMVVVAIIAILALTAVPTLYQGVVRQQIKDSMPLADLARDGVASFYRREGKMPANNAAANVPPANKIIGNYVTSVTVADGAVTMTFGNSAYSAVKGKKLTWRPAIVVDAPTVPIAWVCGGKAPPNGMTAQGRNETTLPGNVMPGGCG